MFFKYWNRKIDIDLAVRPWCKNQNLFYHFESWEEENQFKTPKNCCDIGFLVTDLTKSKDNIHGYFDIQPFKFNCSVFFNKLVLLNM